MKSHGRTFSSVLIFIFYVLLCSCGGGGGGGSGGSSQTVSGVAAIGLPLDGTITLQDSSATSRQLVETTANDGSFTLNVAGLTAPYLLRATGTTGGNSYTLYSLVTGPGTCNINPLTDLAVTMSNLGQEPTAIFNSPTPLSINALAANLSSAVTNIQNQLAPLFVQVGETPNNIITDKYAANSQGLDLLLEQITITVANGNLSITNATSGAIILPSISITSGTFNGTLNVNALGLYTISGNVTNALGSALSNVILTLSGSSSKTTMTNSGGNFTFVGTANGTYSLSASLSGYTFSPASISVAVNNENATGQNFTGMTGPALVSIAVTPNNPSIAVGATQQFKATGTYSDNSIQDLTALVTWSSSDTSVATISAGGNAAMVADGTTTISAVSGAVSGKTTLVSTTGAITINW